MRISFLCIIVVALCSCVSKSQEFDAARIMTHIRELTSDSLKGRATGSPGESAAASYIESEFSRLDLQPKGDDNSFFQTFPFSKGVHGQGESATARNVVAYLDNKAKTTTVIGAHYDHLGTDGQGSSLNANPANQIHNGADDNASGVAGVIALANYFANNNRKEQDNFLFVCFSGEELGLLGSKYFTEHPPVDLASVDFMINMDMIGRMDPTTKNVFVHGTGTSPVWEPLIKKINTGEIKIVTDSSGTGPSDHTSFYLKGIPVLHFFTGGHEDYHKPSDDAEKINAAGEIQVLKIITQIVESLDTVPKLAFLATRNRMQSRQAAFKVTLGIMPSYAGGVVGLKVDGVSEGKPAALAGIRTGDIITKMGEFEISDIYGYMESLGKFQKGQTIPVKVKRGNEEIDLTVTF